MALLAACNGQGDPAAQTNSAPAASAPTPPSAPAVPVGGPKRLVLAFGDSLYAGYGLARGQSLPDALQTRLRAAGIDATFINAGVSGDTTAGGRRRLAYTLDRLERRPDLVLLGLGGNDVLRQVPPAETRANLEAMLAELDRRRIPVVMTGMLAPPNLGPDFAGRFNAIFPDLARQHDAPLDPFILQGVIGNRALMLPDGVHPNPQGVERIADRLAPLVARRLAALPRDDQ
ncbi:arylesterase [Sphingomonas abaci]|uniref:Acyl-CoA thioesterase-1 n=1 Tax=Sphingomonas abaci TaxID=237611 RepID=A0A7W7ALJ9_9SPHN|nr:arylesterase [Sphingomonas abaci]MBB4618360.1 acyl-CoA thioesterase-1 [Sphingomonas abaci]